MGNAVLLRTIADKATFNIRPSEVLGFEVEKLLDPSLSTAWRSSGLSPMDHNLGIDLTDLTQAEKGFTGLDSALVDAAGLVFFPGDVSINAEARVYSGPQQDPYYKQLAPDGVVSSVNMENNDGSTPLQVARVDDDPFGVSDGESWVTATVDSAFSVEVTFPTPDFGLPPGNGLRNQIMQIRMSSLQTDGDQYESVLCEVKDGGVTIATESFKLIDDSTEEVIQLVWNGSDLAGGDGSDVTLLIQNGTSPATSLSHGVRIHSIRWLVDSTSDSNDPEESFIESGWVPLFPSGDLAGTGENTTYPYKGPIPANIGGMVLYLDLGDPEFLQPTKFVGVDIRDVYRGLSRHSEGDDFNSYIQARRLVIGRRVETAVGFSRSSDIGVIDPSEEIVGPSGAMFRDDQPRYRQFNLSFESLTNNEALSQIFFGLDRQEGDIIVVLRPTLTSYRHNLSIYGRIQPTPISFAGVGWDEHARTLTIRERIA